jgi:hypothetical protein
LADLINNNSFSIPHKASTNTQIFAFTGKWKDYNTGNIYYQNEYYPDGLEDASDFDITYPTSDLKLFPYFDVNDRYYTINFYNYDYPENDIPYLTLQGLYESTVSSTVNADSEEEAKLYYCYKPDDDKLSDPQISRYTFKGWQSENDFNNKVNKPTLYNLSETKIYSDMNLFAYYEVETVNATASDLKYFDINDNSIKVKNNYR